MTNKAMLEKALHDLEKHYNADAVADMIAAAYNALEDYIFSVYRIGESWDEMQARQKRELVAYQESDNALIEAEDELHGIVVTLSNVDDCDGFEGTEYGDYIAAEEEARGLLEKVGDALEYIADAKQAYNALWDNMKGLECLARE